MAKLTEKEKLSIQTNYLGTPEAMYREDGEAVWSCELNSYGKVRDFQGEFKTECPFRFQGQYHDNETGLYYNRFRYYSPEEGMYISQDPIRLDGGVTPYSYVRDTNSWIDEFGLACEKYRKRTPKQVARLRKNFENRLKKRYLKNLSKDKNKIKELGLSGSDVEKLKKGNVPDGYVVHHKKPLYRGGNNSNDNLDLIKRTKHDKDYSAYHNYPEGANPYGDKYN